MKSNRNTRFGIAYRPALWLGLFAGISGIALFQMFNDGATRNAAVAAPDAVAQASPVDLAEYENLIREKSRLEGENSSLKASGAQFESEKNLILNQVRTSVKAFDDYRKQMTDEVKALNDQIVVLNGENAKLKQDTASRPSGASGASEADAVSFHQLQEENQVYKETIAILQQEIEEKQDRKILVEAAKLHYNVANFYFRNKEYQSAVEEYRKALTYQPNDSDVHYNLAIVCDEYLGDRKTALEHYKKYLSVNPEGAYAPHVEDRILDLELYETVLSGDKSIKEKGKVKWLDSTLNTTVSEFRGG
jgi:tetratricopeptide (TPR) repeat protein